MKKEKRLGLAFILILVPVLLFVLISSLGHSFLNLYVERPVNVSKGWSVEVPSTGFSSYTHLPSVIQDIPLETEVRLSKILPFYDLSTPTLYFTTDHQNVRVLFNGNKIYEYSPQKGLLGSSPGSAIHFIPLPDNYYKGKIEVIIISPYAQFSGILSEISLGNRNSHVVKLLEKDILPFGLAITIFFEGVILAFIYAALRYSKIRNAGILYLAFFSLIAGVWMMAERRIVLFFIPDPAFVLYISLISLFCLPIPVLLFVGRSYCPKNPNILINTAWAFFWFILAATVLNIFHIADYVVLVPAFHVLTVFAIAVISWVGFREIKNGNREIRAFFLACSVFALFIFTDIALYYFADHPKMSSHTYFQIGMLGFILITGSSLGENLFHLREMNIRNELLLSLAYTDGLTRLKNRRSFDEMIAALNTNLNNETSVHMIILDINNLKSVNDRLGHSQGDLLILEGTKIMRESIGMLGEVYRIGGDEFAIIIRHTDAETINEAVSQLFEMIDSYNARERHFKISIAYGISSYQKGLDTDLNDVFIRADRAMYICKENQKQIRVVG